MRRFLCVFGDGNADPTGVTQHFFQLWQGLFAICVPIITVGAVKNVNVVIPGQVFFFNNFVNQTVC